MTDSELKNLLNSIGTAPDSKSKQKTLEKALQCARKRVKPIPMKAFILNQIHYIKPLHPVMCLLLMLATPVLAAFCNKLQLILFISLYVPLLSCITVPQVISQLDSGMMELESSTFYSAGTVLSARLVIYGITNFTAVFLSAVFTATVSGSFMWILLFEIALFTASSLISLAFSVIMQNQYSAAAGAAVNTILAMQNAVKSALKAEEILHFTNFINYTALGITAVLTTVLLAGALWLLRRNYNFNGEILWKLHS